MFVRVASSDGFSAASAVASEALHAGSRAQFRAAVFAAIDRLIGIDAGAIVTVEATGVSEVVASVHDASAMAARIDNWLAEIAPREMTRLLDGAVLDSAAFSSRTQERGLMYVEHFHPHKVRNFLVGLSTGRTTWGYNFCRVTGSRRFGDKDVKALNELLPVIAAGEELWSRRSSSLATSGMETAFERLSQRQREIVHLVTRGLKNSEIAHLLGISVNTVRNILATVFERMSVTNRTELTYVASPLDGYSRDESSGTFWTRLRQVLPETPQPACQPASTGPLPSGTSSWSRAAV
jgi:DNA-binding CsgD family transcriptional regulator